MFFPREFGIAAMLYGTQHMTLTVDQKSNIEGDACRLVEYRELPLR